MILKSRHFLLIAASATLFAGTAQAQPDDYAPPPVDLVEPGEAPRPLPTRVAPPENIGDFPEGGGDRQQRRGRVDVGGYVEGQIGVSAELGDDRFGDDTLTYSAVAAGVDGQVSTRRVVASFGYRYDRRIELSGDLPDSDVHSGIAQIRAEVAPNLVQVEAGGIATRTGGNGRALGVTEGEGSAQIFAGYAGPTLSTRSGNVAINAFYRLGYVNVDDDSLAGVAAGDENFNSTVHLAGASVGAAPGPNPFGWTISAGHLSTSTSLFDSRYSGQFVRGDLVFPVNPALALTAGAGWSRSRATQRDFLRDANGVPVFDGDGYLFPDPNGPRVVAYDQDGLFADAGFIWRPSPRSELQLRAGINDDGQPIVAGSVAFQIGRSFGISGSIYDDDTTFGGNLVNSINNLPDEFKVERDPLSGGLAAGCVFSEDKPGQGVCLSPALQALTGASYRVRGGSMLFSGNGRFWSWGGGVTYTHRGYHLPDDPIFESAYAPNDQDFALFASADRRLGRDASIGFDGFLSLYDSEDETRDATTLGGRVNFNRGFLLNRLELTAALGLTHRSLFEASSLVADGIVGLRYNF